MRSDLAAAVGRVSALTQRLHDAEARMEAMHEDHTALCREHDALAMEHDAARATIAKLQARVKELEGERRAALAAEEAATEAQQASVADVDDARDEAASYRAMLESAETRAARAERLAAAGDPIRLQALEEELASTQDEVSELRQALDAAERALARRHAGEPRALPSVDLGARATLVPPAPDVQAPDPAVLTQLRAELDEAREALEVSRLDVVRARDEANRVLEAKARSDAQWGECMETWVERRVVAKLLLVAFGREAQWASRRSALHTLAETLHLSADQRASLGVPSRPGAGAGAAGGRTEDLTTDGRGDGLAGMLVQFMRDEV